MTDASPEAGDLYCTGFRLRRATRRATQIYDRALMPFGLTVTQYGLLAMLARDGAMPLGRLADRMGMDRTSITRTIRPIEKSGYVTLESHPDDRRVRKVALTGAGERAFAGALGAWQAAQRHLNRQLGPDKIAHLHALLGDVAALEDLF